MLKKAYLAEPPRIADIVGCVPRSLDLFENTFNDVAMDWETRITLNPDILVGKPIIKGTRIAVEFIINLLAQGWSIDEILRNYPGITVEDIQACLSYASVMLKSEKVYAIPA
ncbi:MAG UNVERIFIED_CONTAM: DUF433 domain-containing protein [Microcystis novacekii LVE1205-3]|jgi:uncharacterized protein (DUF433 family)